MDSKYDVGALFKIGYGLYVVTASDDLGHDNGCIINAVMQVTDAPHRIIVCINKLNYTHDLVLSGGKLNVNCLTVDTPFSVFKDFGFRSGRDADKFDGVEFYRSSNGLAVLKDYINAYISLSVEEYIDFGTHGMFVCSVSDAVVVSNTSSLTYDYYQKHIKPMLRTKSHYVCRICGYVYEGDDLPDDYICPTCKHSADSFELVE